MLTCHINTQQTQPSKNNKQKLKSQRGIQNTNLGGSVLLLFTDPLLLPTTYRPKELSIKIRKSSQIDVWSLGCSLMSPWKDYEKRLYVFHEWLNSEVTANMLNYGWKNFFYILEHSSQKKSKKKKPQNKWAFKLQMVNSYYAYSYIFVFFTIHNLFWPSIWAIIILEKNQHAEEQRSKLKSQIILFCT